MAKDKDRETPGSEHDDGIISIEEILAEYSHSDFDTGELYRAVGVNDERPDNIIDFPVEEQMEAEPPNPIARKLEEKLESIKRKEEDYASHMYENEGEEFDDETLLAEELLPAVDQEEDEQERPRAQKRRKRVVHRPPDTDPRDLMEHYTRGLLTLRVRTIFVFVLVGLQAVLAGAANARLFVDAQDTHALVCYLSAGLLIFAMALGFDRIAFGVRRMLQGRLVMESVVAISSVVAILDAVTMPLLSPRGGQLPYCGVVTAAIGCYMFGAYRKRQGQRLACRLAAGAREPYRVTLEEEVWNGRDSFVKARGGTEQFGSQLQEDDGAERMYGRILPVFLLVALVLSVIASLGQGKPERFLWSLSACLCAITPLYAVMAYGSPYYQITRRLGKSGAALAGWASADQTRSGDGILLTDSDLFPPGMVSLNGVKVFGKITAETALMSTHALLTAAHSGLEKVFSDQLRQLGCSPRKASEFAMHDGDGISGYVKDQHVLVGSAAFMKIMSVTLVEGLNVPNAVFCAINGRLAAVFAIHYSMHGNIYDAVTGLVKDGLTPIFATRDFNISPTMLDKRWRLPVHKMQFPAYGRRMELSDHSQWHTGPLTALLVREGLVPYYDAVLGARQLRRTVRLGVGLVCLGAVVGLVFAFYLCFHEAFTSLSCFNLMLFMGLWTLPNYFVRLLSSSEG